MRLRRGRGGDAAVGGDATRAELDALVERRAAGEPLEQVVGWAEFAGLRIVVDPGVFVPRRRSEFLVSVAVGLAGWRPDGGEIPVVVDLCCGTGALGLAVASGLGGWADLHAADLDPAAVACARRNVEPAGGHVYVGDLFGALPGGLRGRADILICNAPYVPTGRSRSCRPRRATTSRWSRSTAASTGSRSCAGPRRRRPTGSRPAASCWWRRATGRHRRWPTAMAAAGLSPAIHTDEDWGATVVTGRAADR